MTRNQLMYLLDGAVNVSDLAEILGGETALITDGDGRIRLLVTLLPDWTDDERSE